MTSSAESHLSWTAILVDVDNVVGGYFNSTSIRVVADLIPALRVRFNDALTLVLFTSLTVPDELLSIDAQWVVLPGESGSRLDAAITARAIEEIPRVRQLVIVSGDSEFSRVLTTAAQKGVRTVVVADVKTASKALTSAADEWITIADLLGSDPGGVDGASSSTAVGTDTSLAADEPTANDEAERDHVTWRDDEPVVSAEDRFGRAPVAAVLVNQLSTLLPADRGRPGRSFLVHIDGQWGAGKSTLMGFVRESADKLGWLTVSYDAWRQSKAGPTWQTLLEAIRTAILVGKGNSWLAQLSFWVRERNRLVARWQWVAAALITLALLIVGGMFVQVTSGFTMAKWGDVAKLAAGLVPLIAAAWLVAGSIGRFATLDSRRAAKTFVDSRADPMEDLAKHFRWVLGQAGRPVLLMIDDLDRCPESHVVDVLETVQKLLRDHSTGRAAVARRPVHSLFILVAADGRWIRASYDNTYAGLDKAVGDPGASIGTLFVQKLFQLTVPVPRLSEALKQQFIADLLSNDVGASRHARDDAEASLSFRIGEAESTEDILNLLESVSQAERIMVADEAIQRMVVEPDAHVRTRHALQPFAKLVDSNPRSLKRYLMAYSMLRAVRTAEGSVPRVPELALWTLLVTRWPTLGDYLERYPESIKLFKSTDERALKAVPVDLVSLFTNPPPELMAVIEFDDEVKLDAEAIRKCSGQAAGAKVFR